MTERIRGVAFTALLLVLIAGCVAAPPVRIVVPVDEAPPAEWAPKEAPLMSPWAGDVDPGNVLPEYPRPQMVRDRWLNLNGLWQFTFPNEGDAPPIGRPLDRQILVPFALESALSGVMERSERITYRRTFEVPAEWAGERVLLHFGAVDWDATVYVNGREIGSHRGGYDAFSFDVTDALVADGPQELIVVVFDPADAGDQPRGKQVANPQGIWYTPVTGIWQTVWLEPVPQVHIEGMRLVPDITNGVLHVTVDGTGGDHIIVTALDGGRQVGRVEGATAVPLQLTVPNARLWSPDDPFLYDLRIELQQSGRTVDTVDSYFGMREAEVGPGPDGEPRLLLNGEFVFQVGPLDQGYWPDGLYTAPTDEALRFDLEATKELGYNMNRKHVKVEPARWYYWADRLGVLIWQDMPNGDNTTPESQRQFETELHEMVTQFINHPSIIMWVVFNEGWGQYDVVRVTEEVERLDPSRIVMDVSGWQHMGAGEVLDVHRYQGPVAMEPADGKASVVGEFGGLGLPVEGHLWRETSANWGYEGTYDTSEELADRYELLLNRMWRLREAASMSAGVYTQLTDVETEVNGLYTYDRKVLKADREQLASVNSGHTPFITPDFEEFVTSTQVEIKSWIDGAEIRYTLDGSIPTSTSPRYEQPFEVDASTTVRAQNFVDGRPVGHPTTATFEKVSGRAPVAVDADLEPGIAYGYFESPPNNRPPYARHWPIRQFAGGNDRFEPVATGTLDSITLNPAQRDELFAFIYEGYLEVPETGVYTFHIHADESARIRIGGEKIGDRMGQSPAMTTTTSSVALQAGMHPFQVNYFQAYGPSGLEIEIEGPGVPRQPLSSALLYHDPRGM